MSHPPLKCTFGISILLPKVLRNGLWGATPPSQGRTSKAILCPANVASYGEVIAEEYEMSKTFYVNVDSAQPPKIHESNCKHVPQGGRVKTQGGWYGPYASYQEALSYALTRVRTSRPTDCKDCLGE
jgi:hypothetical protein